MAVSKVVYAGNTLIDLTGDTVAADKLLSGYTAHDAAGNAITGTATAGGGGLPAEIVAGDTPVMMDGRVVTATSSSWAETAMTITIPKAGTYRFKWIMGDSYSGYTRATRLYKNGVAAGTEHSYNAHGDVYCTDDIECAAGDVMTMYIKGYRNFGSYYGTAGNLVACIDWDNGF